MNDLDEQLARVAAAEARTAKVTREIAQRERAQRQGSDVFAVGRAQKAARKGELLRALSRPPSID